MNFADAAEQVLRDSGEPLAIADITQRALERGLITPRSDTPVTYVRAAIRKDSLRRENRGEPVRFELISPGIYRLQQSEPTAPRISHARG
jgi:hypothetical protein